MNLSQVEQVSGAPTSNAPVHDLVLANVHLFPRKVAIQEGAECLTFEELERRSGLIARNLLTSAAGIDEPIAVLLPACIQLIAAELGIMRAGAAFLPIDPAYPPERIEHILSQARTSTVLTTHAYQDRVPAGKYRIVHVDDPEFNSRIADKLSLPTVNPNSLAYVIFTSGSSGRPKGVMIEHRNLVNLIGNFQTTLGVSAQDRSSVISSPAFDASIAEIWPYLATGASIHIPPPNLKMDLTLLLDWIRREKITISLLPTALVELALDKPLSDLPNLRVLMTGGDQLHKLPANRLPFRFLNAYGPTECTVISTWTDVEPDLQGKRPPSIGQTIEGGNILILDDELQETPVGIAGEIYIGGAGVGRGYLNNPEGTNERFIPDPRDPGGSGRLYRTGDRACWRGNGDIAFLGRIDRQISLRGFRIEPAEIEVPLRQQEGVNDAVIVLQKDGQSSRLVAFLASDRNDPAALEVEVRERLSRLLPYYMQPAAYVVLDRFPLTTHGKTDVSRLPMPSRTSQASGSRSREVESVVLETWRSLLGVQDCQGKSFFQLGGDSLLMIRMLGDIERSLNVRLPASEFLRDPTIDNCIDLIRGGPRYELPSCIVSVTPPGDHDPLFESRAPFFCVVGAGGGTHWLREIARASQLRRRFYGLETLGLPEGLRANFSIQACARYFLTALRQVQPTGPYVLGGYSLGGLMAIEMAQDLLQAGERVEPVILIDTYADAANPGRLRRIGSFVHRLATAPRSDAKHYVLDKLDWFSGRLRSQREVVPEFDAIQADKQREIETALEYMRNDIPLCQFPLRVIASRYGSRYGAKSPDRGWTRFAGAGLEVYEISGDHYSIVKEPHVSNLGERLHGLIEG